MSSHTPGPWYHWDNGSLLGVGKSHSDEADILNAVSQSNRSRSEDVANMRLAAAAPDLLNALRLLLDKAYKQNFNDSYPELISSCEAVIEQATQ